MFCICPRALSSACVSIAAEPWFNGRVAIEARVTVEAHTRVLSHMPHGTGRFYWAIWCFCPADSFSEELPVICYFYEHGCFSTRATIEVYRFLAEMVF